MAYETASATNVADLIDRLRIFALAEGWTVDFHGARSDGTTGVVLLVSKSGVFLGFASNLDGDSLNYPGPWVATFHYPGPYNSGANPMAQANSSGIAHTINMPGPFQAYHFFADGTYLHAVVEVAPGSFRHFGGGVLDKAGAVTSGQYVYGTLWDQSAGIVSNPVSPQHTLPFDDLGSTANSATVIRADSDSISPRHIRMYDSSGGGWGGFRRSSAGQRIQPQIAGLSRVGPSAQTGRDVLLPLFCGVHRPSSMISIIGAPPDIRFVRVDNLQPGAVITLGADDWKTFPAVRKNGAAGQESSGTYGYAYRVVT